MNPAILGALLRTLGRAAAFSAADRVVGGGKDREPSAREEAERMIAARQREREAIFTQSRSADPQEQKEKSLRQRISDVVFAQSESKRGRIERDQEAHHAIRQPSPGQESHHVGRRQIDEEEDGIEKTKTFSDRLRDGAAAVTGFLGPIGKAAVVTVGFVKGLELMNTGVLALNRDLAQFNGQLAAAYASYEVDEMQRSVYRGEELSGPLSELAAAQSELRDGTNRVSTQIQGMTIGVLAKVTEGVNWLNKMTGLTDKVSGTLEKIREWLFGKDAAVDAGPWQTFFADVQDGKFDGKRPTFTGPKNLHSDKDMKDIFG